MEKQKTIRPRNWLYELLIIAEVALLIALWQLYFRNWWKAALCGSATYLILAYTLRHILQMHHRQGIRFMRLGDFENALNAFQRSYDFFSKHYWIDRFRFITMFTSSAISFRDMALNNMGVCYLRLKQPQKAIEVLIKLKELDSNIPGIQQAIDAVNKSPSNNGGAD